jgi:hypothetical protein
MNLFILHQPVTCHGMTAIVVGCYKDRVLLQFIGKCEQPPVVYAAKPEDIRMVKAVWIETASYEVAR